ncbi:MULTISPECIES: hypothetical protein [Agrobacterium]|jgi:hypothetical protein|uniref:hypothetical protein n=1 Tax=Agrobacterium TaxID=357 RepID=UPI0011789928|nr:hypothetical protein [Agrobacterium fabrum]MCR6724936.1 hypothetical protein [Agrobacterium fabrum]UXT57315.1 hypothetical protein FY134_06475 [Agrobacterium fabrum]WCK77600.1 hypothetical protein G6L39_006540 [Agrobacterium fabrum]WIE28640.1 hypothetical protein G6L42_006255 [Agrobacterium fabrum]WIE44598.1 hypothetical protein G6L76_006255 [Agrobacterium fabrum]
MVKFPFISFTLPWPATAFSHHGKPGLQGISSRSKNDTPRRFSRHHPDEVEIAQGRGKYLPLPHCSAFIAGAMILYIGRARRAKCRFGGGKRVKRQD